MSNSYRFGGGADETVLSPIVLLATLIAIVLLMTLPRKHLMVPFLVVGFFAPLGQTLVIGGFHLFIIRILILVGCFRLFTMGAFHRLPGGFNGIDKVFLGWALSRSLAFMILYGEGQAVVNQVGFLWDALGGYFFLRCAIANEDDVHLATKIFACFVVVVGCTMLLEQRTMSNLFGYIGGAPGPAIREGKARSQGPFAHAILAGTFAATIVPLLCRFWISSKKNRTLAGFAILGALAMVLTSGSSTPFGAIAAGMLGVCLWPMRRRMRELRWGLIAGLSALAVVMKAPVWFLLARIDLVGGSSGYHRAMLVDQCIRHFWDWCFIGVSNNHEWGWDMWDVQNQFVAEAFKGGIVTLTFFILIIARAFGAVGRARKRAPDRAAALRVWMLGVVVLAHIVAFFGADYFDQTRFWWYSTLAMISASTMPLLKKKKEEVAAAETAPAAFAT